MMQELDLTVQVSPRRNLVPVTYYEQKPSYYMVGGLVFCRLVQPFLHEYGEDWYNTSPRKLSYKSIFGILEKQNQEIIILSHVLVDEINDGYQLLTNLEVKEVNGTKLHNLAHLVELVECNSGTHIRFDLDDHM